MVQGPGEYFNAGLNPDGSWILYVESTRPAPDAPAPPQRLMRRPVGGGSAEMVTELPPLGLPYAYLCPPKPGAGCVLSLAEGKDVVFYTLDLFRGKGDRIAVIRGAEDWPDWWL
jgi:hypothetical protein